MFVGEAEHSLDAKGRVVLPAKYRERLRHGAFMTKGKGRFLCVYPPDEFERVADQARDMARQGGRELEMARNFFAGAEEITPDGQGRVAIPANLRQYAGLEREVIVAGVLSRIEIWDRERWRQRATEGDQGLTESADLPDFGL
jgi:MraZ protein